MGAMVETIRFQAANDKLDSTAVYSPTLEVHVAHVRAQHHALLGDEHLGDLRVGLHSLPVVRLID